MDGTADFSKQEIEDQLARILASPEFEASPRTSQLLAYLVSETLAGRGDRVKGYSIGVEVFGRDEDFDPQADTVVRVQAGRLRRALELYYARAGTGDDIVVSLPRGSYVPRFDPREEVLAGPEQAPALPAATSPRAAAAARGPSLWSLAVLAASACLLAVAVFLWWQAVEREPAAEPQTADASVHDDNRPTLAVIPFTPPGEMAVEDRLAWGLSRQLVSDLARFRQILVVGVGAVTGTEVERVTPDVARFVLTGTVRIAGASVRVTANLADVSTSGVLWSQTFERSSVVQTMDKIESGISREIAATLGQAYGVINTVEQRRLSGSDGIDRSYRCLLRFFQYAADKNIEQHKEVRACLEEAVKTEPDYAPAWAALSWMYGDEVRYGFNRRSEVGAVRRSVLAAEEGVRRDPYDPMTHQYLAAALFLSGENDTRVTEELERALQLNPYSSDLLADAGWTMAVLGGWTRGIELMRQAIELNQSHPRWYYGIIGLHEYLTADYDAAVALAQQYFQSEVLFAHVLLTASLARAGRWDEAYEAGEDLMRAFPNFPVDGRAELASWRFAPQVVNRLFSGLRAVGLQVQPASSAESSL